LSAVVRFQPLAGSSLLFADVGAPDQLVSFVLPFPGDYDYLKDSDSTLSGNLVLGGFRSAVARVPVPLPTQRQDFVVAGRKCTLRSSLHESKYYLVFDCVELEPGNTSRFEVLLPRDDSGPRSLQCQGQSSSAGSWPAFLSPIIKSSVTCEFTPPQTDSSADPAHGQELLVFAEESLGASVRTFRIEHFRPAQFGLQAWEERGVLKAESTGTQSNGRTLPKTQ
jgi:hypothetical protein